MPRKKRVLSIAALCCLLSVPIYSQEPARSAVQKPDTHLESLEAEVHVSLLKLEYRVSRLKIQEAMVELEKLTLHLDAITEEKNSRNIAQAKLEIKQAEIRVEMKRFQSEMILLRIERAKARLGHIRATINGKAKDG
jgi:hypothetical protein